MHSLDPERTAEVAIAIAPRPLVVRSALEAMKGTASAGWNRRGRYGARGRSGTESLDKVDLRPV